MELIKALYHFLKALLAVVLYGYPASGLIIIAVTGTSGKTTTSHITYSILKENGFRVSLISSVEAIIGGKKITTGLHVTTPDSFLMQKLIRQAKDAGDKYLVIEASSHGIAQYRMLGTNVALAVLTNISHEHLDWHKTFKAYQETKTGFILKSRIGIVNQDDQSYQYIQNTHSKEVLLFTYGLNSSADFNPQNLLIESPMPGQFNLYNALAGAAVAKLLGLTDNQIKKSLRNFAGVKGRFENVKNKRGLNIIVDFAHKPNALEELLKTLQDLASSRIIIMFGCAGDRDKAKREMMGQIAGKYADLTVITAEDPRNENVDDIISEIAKGALKSGAIEVSPQDLSARDHGKHIFVRIADRRQAIDRIINDFSRKGDLIAFLGKSHESSMCIGTTEYPWDEFMEIDKALNLK